MVSLNITLHLQLRTRCDCNIRGYPMEHSSFHLAPQFEECLPSMIVNSRLNFLWNSLNICHFDCCWFELAMLWWAMCTCSLVMKKVEKTVISHEAASQFFSTCCRMDQFCQDPHEFLQVGEFCLVKEYFSIYMPVQMCRKKFKCWWKKTLKPILNWPELHLRV